MTRYTEALHLQRKTSRDMDTFAYAYAKGVLAWDKHMLRHSRPNIEQLASVMDSIHYILDAADTYFLSSIVEDALLVARDNLPGDCQYHKESVPTPLGFMLLEHPLPPITPNSDVDTSIDAISWWVDVSETHYTALVCWAYAGQARLLMPCLFTSFKDGETIAAITELQPSFSQPLRFIMALFNFLDQQLVEPAREALPRQERRAIERKSGGKPANVNIIRLRRRYVQHPTDPNAPHREYQYQWAVRGHWRKQPYRSKGPDYYKYIYIAPYLKGPEDRPLKGTDRVYAVVR